MKKTLLFTLFLFVLAFAANAQTSSNGQLVGQFKGCDTDTDANHTDDTMEVSATAKKKKISVFPNPAANYIELSEAKNVTKIVIFNVMGREAKSFQVEKGVKYNVTDLKRGMYLVQLLDGKNKVITTQRLNKT